MTSSFDSPGAQGSYLPRKNCLRCYIRPKRALLLPADDKNSQAPLCLARRGARDASLCYGPSELILSGSEPLFRWGIIGSGFAARKFVFGLRHLNEAAPTLVYSRNQENARSFAKDFGIAEVATGLEAATQSRNVDAFYIATPPSVHRAQAIVCLAAGKPVLIEKPFATTKSDALAIVDAAREQDVFCMEGMWTRFLPLAARLRAMVSEGAIGTPRSLAGSFGAPSTPDQSDNQFLPELGGGALLHRGVYVMAIAFDLFGPAQLVASAATPGATGVDEDCSLVLRHERGVLTTIRASLRAPLPNDLTIEGTHGLLRVAAPIYRPFRMRLTKTRPTGRIRRINSFIESLREGAVGQAIQQRFEGIGRLSARRSMATFTATYSGNGYHYEAEEVMRCVRRGAIQSELMPLKQSVDMAALMEQARKSWFPQEVAL